MTNPGSKSKSEEMPSVFLSTPQALMQLSLSTLFCISILSAIISDVRQTYTFPTTPPCFSITQRLPLDATANAHVLLSRSSHFMYTPVNLNQRVNPLHVFRKHKNRMILFNFTYRKLHGNTKSTPITMLQNPSNSLRYLFLV